MIISMIVAVAENYGIGINNSLPWAHIPQDMKWFKENTAGKLVVMGSSTWDSLPRKPLPGRTNVVLSSRRASGYEAGDYVFDGSPKDILYQIAQHCGDQEEIVIMGGAKVYEDWFPYANRLYITRVNQRVEADTYLNVDALMQQHTMDSVQFKLQFRQTHFDPDHITFEIWEK